MGEPTQPELRQLEEDREVLRELIQEGERVIQQLEADIAVSEESIGGR